MGGSTRVPGSPTKEPQDAAHRPVGWRSCFRSDLFRGKVALVTGGGTGLGYAVALELALTGCRHVVIASRNAGACRQAADGINRAVHAARSADEKELGGSKAADVVIAGPSTNIRKADEVAALIAFCLREAGSLDLLVNNAGGQFLSPAEKISERRFASVVETNLVGTFLVCQQAYLQYMKEHGGAIVNITLGNRNGFPLMAHSGASRAGVENLSATLCTEWVDSGVRINCVRPGIIFTESGFAHYGPAGDKFVKGLLPVMPSKRFGSPQELSSAVVWLLSEGASYVTGAILCVDGGSSYSFLPLAQGGKKKKNKASLPVYGELPFKARL